MSASSAFATAGGHAVAKADDVAKAKLWGYAVNHLCKRLSKSLSKSLSNCAVQPPGQSTST